MKLKFLKTHDKSCPKIQFLLILDKYLKGYGNINAILPLFDMGTYQIWSYHVTQGENLSFLCIEFHCPLNVRKCRQFLLLCFIPNGSNGSYEEDNLREGRIGLRSVVKLTIS